MKRYYLKVWAVVLGVVLLLISATGLSLIFDRGEYVLLSLLIVSGLWLNLRAWKDDTYKG